MNNLIKNNNIYIYIYDTNEHIVGKWVDGSPIYEKTYSKSASVGTTSFNLSDVDMPISVKGILITDKNVYFLNYTNNTAASYVYAYYQISNKLLNVTSNSTGTLYLTVQYLK